MVNRVVDLSYKKEMEAIYSESELKWCSVQLSEIIERGSRLEASVFDVEAKKARDLIIHGKYEYVPLLGENGLINTAYYPGRFKRIYCDRINGEPFYLPSQMTDIYPKADKYISSLTKCNMDELRLKENTLLLTRSGTIGNISLVSETIKNKVFSDDVIRVTFKNIEDLGYTYAFLKSKVGNTVLQTNGYGSVITHLEPEHLKETPIPNPPSTLKMIIHNKVIESFKLRDESNVLIDKALELLVDELKLPSIDEFDNDVLGEKRNVESFSVKLSELTGRLDVSYHVPIVKSIVEHISKYAEEVTCIDDKRISKSVVLPGRFKRVYVEEGHGKVLFGGKQIHELDPSNKKFLSLSKHSKRIAKELEIAEKMILITRSGTIGKVNFVPKHWEHYVASEHIIRVVPSDDEIAGYIYIYLLSEYGYYLTTRFTYGSVVDEIDDNHVRRIPIPILKNKDVQKEINDLALRANKKRYEAYISEQEALRMIEEDIIYADEKLKNSSLPKLIK